MPNHLTESGHVPALWPLRSAYPHKVYFGLIRSEQRLLGLSTGDVRHIAIDDKPHSNAGFTKMGGKKSGQKDPRTPLPIMKGRSTIMKGSEWLHTQSLALWRDG